MYQSNHQFSCVVASYRTYYCMPYKILGSYTNVYNPGQTLLTGLVACNSAVVII